MRANEAVSINLSLTTLGMCINARADPNAAHVPFRDSKLTRLLQVCSVGSPIQTGGANTLASRCCCASPMLTVAANADVALFVIGLCDRMHKDSLCKKQKETPSAPIEAWHAECEKGHQISRHWLQESLGGNAKTSLVIAVANAVQHSEETLQSLQFGSRAMRVQTQAVVNECIDFKVLCHHLSAWFTPVTS